MAISNEWLIALLRRAAATEAADVARGIDLDEAFQKVMSAPLEPGGASEEHELLKFPRQEEQTAKAERPAYFLAASEGQQGKAADSARKIGEVRRLEPVQAAGTTWQADELTWEEVVAVAELLISVDKHHAAIRVTGAPSYWGYKAEVLPQPDDRPSHSDDLQSIAERERDGIVSLVIPEGMPPEVIERVALHVLEEGLNYVGCVVFRVERGAGGA